VLGEIGCLRVELWSALCAAARTTFGSTQIGAAEPPSEVRAGRSVRVAIDALRDLDPTGVSKVVDSEDADTVIAPTNSGCVGVREAAGSEDLGRYERLEERADAAPRGG
jgi:hypothetical protein